MHYCVTMWLTAPLSITSSDFQGFNVMSSSIADADWTVSPIIVVNGHLAQNLINKTLDIAQFLCDNCRSVHALPVFTGRQYGPSMSNFYSALVACESKALKIIWVVNIGSVYRPWASYRKFCHRPSQQQINNKVVNNDSATPQTCHYLVKH